jgi:predicted permease
MNGDPAIVGKAISLGGVPHTVVGVLGEFDIEDLFSPTPQVWVPFQLDPESRDHGHYFQSAGHIKAGVSLEQAQARLRASAAGFRAAYNSGIGPQSAFSVEPVGEVLVRNIRQSLFVLAGAVGFVLLIACANVANLLLVRATGRKREIAVRAALGGSRGRIISQVLTESMVLSVIGGALGLALGVVAIRAMLSLNTAGLPRVGEDGLLVGVDWRVLAFTTGLSLLTGFVFGLIPALQSSRTDLTATLKETGGRSGTGCRQNKTRSILVVVEVALALTLLVGSALLIRSAIALGRVAPGFDAENVLTMRMSLTGPEHAASQAVHVLVRNGVERLKTVPGIVEAAATCCVPLEGGFGLPFVIAGRPLTDDGPFHGGGGWINITPGYFDVFKIPVKRGRDFTDRDDAAGPPVVIVNEAFAREFFKDQDPLEHRLTIGKGVMREFATETERQIIGVVGDVRGSLQEEPGPIMYIPQAQVPDAANALNLGIGPMSWVLRTNADPYALSASVQESLRQSTGLPISQVRSMADVVIRSTSRQRFNMWLMTIFGASALLLAAIGIYGLMAYSVEQRTQEIGIRLSLGADAASVRRMVVVQGMRLAIVGVMVGLAASWGLARFLQSFLYEVEPRDPLVFAGVPILLAFVAFLAVWLPALRASKVDPMVTLRYE